MAVVIDSGDRPSARGLTGGELDRCIGKWQKAVKSWHEEGTAWLLDILDEVDELRLWETYWDGFYPTREEFIAKKLLVNFDFEEQALPALLDKLRRGEDVTPELTKAEARHRRNEEIRRMREAGMTQQAIADEVGMKREAVRNILAQKEGNTEKVPNPKPEVIRMSRDPSRAAQQIMLKYGPQYALQLADALVTEVGPV